eukprot:CAMPEP_0172501022 /NCGR_PEP_ID=MMETSP1066-20121228/145215_1 /TAXON_ID=671091 /ORGANISM="Coscinodiscus wailesii, Strain CCMP2513" /LENGTH=428 /DNA_ID=CAMNT_0013275585 /DNA_START=18 /DNA_END=1304 /DNA_ORIENTATION=-
MGISSYALLLLLALTHDTNKHVSYAFAPSARLYPSSSSSLTHSTSIPLHAQNNNDNDGDRIRKVGCGTPTKPPGGMSLFDPDTQGKLQGTGDLQRRIKNGSSYLPPRPSADVASYSRPTDAPVHDCQNWLEDIGVPTNFAKPGSPAEGVILASGRIISDDAPGDIQHVVMQLPEGMHYVEGQSISVIPPGIDPKTSRPFAPRLYSIASTRYGDLLDGNTVSFCIRRAEFYDPATGLPDPTKKGVCSNFLCDAAPGTKVAIAGPVGKTMLLPDDDTKDIIMIGTGTGIAPFRAFLHRLFMENTVKRHMFQANAWLILGVPVTGGLLYHDEFAAMQKMAPEGAFKIDYAISREMTNARGGKLYVQNVIEENATEFFEKLEKGAQVYFCGLKGMMPPILDTLEEVARKKGIDWGVFLKQLKANHQWHVEVY